MKQILTLFAILLFSTLLHAQVGINNTNPKASLDITATNQANPSNTDGLLIPRIDDFTASNPTAAQQGMMVYLTTTSGGNPPGFYYWDNNTGPAAWVSVVGGTVQKINDLSDGKSDNDGSSVFLGVNAGVNDDSTDNKNVGVGFEALKLNTTGYENTANGYQSLSSNSTGFNNTANGKGSLYSNTTGHNNIAIGVSSLHSNTTGYNNTANGNLSLYNNTTGLANTTYGYQSLYFNTTGSSNNSLGWKSLYSNTFGIGNTAIGNNSLFNNTTGNYNTALGVNSGGSNISGNANVFLGYQSGFNETGSNKLYIENSNANANNALIYGEFDNNILRTNSEFQIGNPTGTGYAFPTTDGSVNQLLVTDGSGQISFETRAVGAQKLDDLIDGKSDSDGTNNFSSVFLGLAAGSSDDSSDNRGVGIGYSALAANTTGFYNSAYGYFSLNSNSNGDYNTAIGNLSLNSLTTGSNNTALGMSAGSTNITGSGNIFVGYQSGLNELGSNTLYIENSNANSSNALIYGEFDTNILRINGELQIGSPTGTGYAFPTVDGTANQVMKTDGSGTISWVSPSSGTDDQNISGSGLSGTNLTIGIENGINQVIDLSSLQDGTGTDDQTIDQFVLSGTTLGISLENDGVAPLTVDLSSLAGDDDWTDVGADIERQTGNVYIGNINTTDNDLYISDRIIDWDATAYYLDPDEISKVDEIEFDNGTVADPSIRFSDIDTGFYSPATATTAYSTNGIESFRINSVGNVLMGNTNSSNYRLIVGSGNNIYLGNKTATDIMKIEHNASQHDGLQINVTSSYTSASRAAVATYNSFTNVISNIASYSEAFGAIGVQNSIGGVHSLNVFGVKNHITNSGTGTQYGVYNDVRGPGSGSKYGSFNYIPTTAGGVSQYGVYSEVLKATGYAGYFLGRVSIGTASGNKYIFPSIRGTNGQLMQTDGTGNLSWVDSSTMGSDNQNITSATLTGNTLSIAIENGSSASVNLSPLQDADWFETGGTPPNDINDTIYTYGNVGIGTASASLRLDVVDSQATSYVARINNSSTNADADGLKIRLARTTPGSNNYYIGFYSGVGSMRGRISGNAATGGVNYTTTSDRRLKTKIINIDNALHLIEKIQPRKYEYKANLGTTEYGFIAQELQLIYPQAVIGSPDSNVETDPMMVDYARLTPILTAGIKELNDKVILLETENKKLKQKLSKYEQLEARLTALENKTTLPIAKNLAVVEE